jgi:hypothetical protein
VIRLDCEQGSPEWFAARLALPTASRFDQIITPKTLKLSASSEKYRNELLAEWLLGESLSAGHDGEFMNRGRALEEEARDWYELQRDVEVERVGFILRDEQNAGCSPDGLVGADGGLEIKCPSAAVHVGYLLDSVGEAYRCQVQGSLWITGRAWWDVLSYHPSLPKALVRVERDEAFIEALARLHGQFWEYLQEGKEALRKRGIHPLKEQPGLRLVA